MYNRGGKEDKNLDLNIGEHYIISLFGLDFNMDTLITLWLSMGFILFFAVLAVAKINIIPTKIQAVFEKMIGFFSSLTDGLGKEKGDSALVLMCIFLVIIIGNLIGQVPLKLFHLPDGEFASPTNDINMTAALAVFVLFYYIFKGVKSKGIGYFKHYFQPIWFMVPFNILEDFTRPLTLALRLFANILAGEILIMVLSVLTATLLTPDAVSGFVAHTLKGWFSDTAIYNIGLFLGSLLPLPIMFFELFVAVVQALVFTLLASAYINNAAVKNH